MHTIKTIKKTMTPIVHYLKFGLRNSLFWGCSKHRNWGDDLNPWLFEKLTGKKAVYCPHKTCRRFIMAGSILTQAGKYDTCWGTGLLRENLTISLKLSKALAVRGPLTAQKLEESGIEAPKIYGDPGIIASQLITLPHNKKYKISVIPHYVDRNEGQLFAKEMGCNIINVDLPIEKFIEEVAKSEQVWSSSLHGIICAESIGIPTVWVRFSDRIIGNSFKYNDYFLGTKRCIKQPLKLFKNYSNIDSSHMLGSIDVKEITYNLLSVFPYKINSSKIPVLNELQKIKKL